MLKWTLKKDLPLFNLVCFTQLFYLSGIRTSILFRNSADLLIVHWYGQTDIYDEITSDQAYISKLFHFSEMQKAYHITKGEMTF